MFYSTLSDLFYHYSAADILILLMSHLAMKLQQYPSFLSLALVSNWLIIFSFSLYLTFHIAELVLVPYSLLNPILPTRQLTYYIFKELFNNQSCLRHAHLSRYKKRCTTFIFTKNFVDVLRFVSLYLCSSLHTLDNYFLEQKNNVLFIFILSKLYIQLYYLLLSVYHMFRY